MANPFKRYVVDAWNAVAKRQGGRFTTGDVEAELAGVDGADIDELRQTAIREAVAAEDKRRRDLANRGSTFNLFDDEAFQGAIPTALGDSSRVVLDDAENFDWLYLLQLKQRHVNEVVAVMNKTMSTYTELAPYLSVPGTRTADARRAWQRDHPDGAPPPI